MSVDALLITQHFFFTSSITFASLKIASKKMELKYIQQAASKFNLSVKQVTNVDQLHSEGATIPFMARYRKEATGNLDEVVIGNIVEEIKYFNELEKRKETV